MLGLKKNIMKINKTITALIVPLFLLVIPLVGMQVSEEVKWTLFDFVFAYALFAGAGLAYVFVSGAMKNSTHRIAVGLSVFMTLALIWANGAVGIIGDEGNAANVLYLIVPAVGLIGAAISRFRSEGLANTLFAMAGAMALVPVIAFIAWRPLLSEPPGIAGVIMLNAVFVIMFAFAGLLFKYSEQ